MRFQDIPEFTRSGSWECTFSLERFITEIQRMVKEENLQLNPDFQRGHVWTKEQSIKFVKFVLQGGKTARVVYFNCPSWNRTLETKYNDFVCVDGLQRITAINDFIQNRFEVFGCFYKDFEDKPHDLHMRMSINVNDLQTKREVLQWYIEINNGGTPHTAAEIRKVEEILGREVQ